MVVVWQYIHILNHYVVHLKLIQCFVNYISAELGGGHFETLKLVIFIIGLREPPPWSPRIFHVLSASCGRRLPTVWKKNSLFFIIDGYVQALAIGWRNVIILHFNEKR